MHNNDIPNSANYRDIPDFPGYQGSDNGIIRSCRYPHGIQSDKWHPVVTAIDNKGYEKINLDQSGNKFGRYVHYIVLEAFAGIRPKGMECRHLDGNPLNNNLANLCWGTHADNLADRKQSGKPWNPRQMDEDKVKQCWRMRSEGKSIHAIADHFQVGCWVIDDIIRGRTWIWVKPRI